MQIRAQRRARDAFQVVAQPLHGLCPPLHVLLCPAARTRQYVGTQERPDSGPGFCRCGRPVGQLGLAIVWSFWHALQPDWWLPLCVLFLANRSRLSRFAHTEHFFPVVVPGIGVVLVAAIVSSSPPRP